MEIIDDLEPVRRGLYAGAVGYFDFAGDTDTAIAIRTAVIARGQAHVQAGAGIVADSDAVSEDAECRTKAMAVLRAVAVATPSGARGDGAGRRARRSGGRSRLGRSVGPRRLTDARGDSGDVVDRRGYAAALTALGIGAALLLLAAGRVWATATTGGGGMPTVVVTLDGRAVAPVAAGAGLLLLAGIVGIVATRGVGRIVVGAILLLAALAATVSALQFGIGGPGTARSKVVESGETLQLTGSMWWLVALIGALLAAGAAVTTLLRGGRWPGMGSRYHRRRRQRPLRRPRVLPPSRPRRRGMRWTVGKTHNRRRSDRMTQNAGLDGKESHVSETHDNHGQTRRPGPP